MFISCHQCGKKFKVIHSNKKQKFCSRECVNDFTREQNDIKYPALKMPTSDSKAKYKIALPSFLDNRIKYHPTEKQMNRIIFLREKMGMQFSKIARDSELQNMTRGVITFAYWKSRDPKRYQEELKRNRTFVKEWNKKVPLQKKRESSKKLQTHRRAVLGPAHNRYGKKFRKQ